MLHRDNSVHTSQQVSHLTELKLQLKCNKLNKSKAFTSHQTFLFLEDKSLRNTYSRLACSFLSCGAGLYQCCNPESSAPHQWPSAVLKQWWSGWWLSQSLSKWFPALPSFWLGLQLFSNRPRSFHKHRMLLTLIGYTKECKQEIPRKQEPLK